MVLISKACLPRPTDLWTYRFEFSDEYYTISADDVEQYDEEDIRSADQRLLLDKLRGHVYILTERRQSDVALKCSGNPSTSDTTLYTAHVNS